MNLTYGMGMPGTGINPFPSAPPTTVKPNTLANGSGTGNIPIVPPSGGTLANGTGAPGAGANPFGPAAPTTPQPVDFTAQPTAGSYDGNGMSFTQPSPDQLQQMLSYWQYMQGGGGGGSLANGSGTPSGSMPKTGGNLLGQQNIGVTGPPSVMNSSPRF